MNFLFFLVHPAKFHFHRVQINYLKANGHNVDIILTSKDILEDLVKEEQWDYINLFPEGRKLKGVHVYVGVAYFFFKTLFRLWKFTKGNKYDLYIGDLLTIIGRYRKVPCLFATDDVLTAVPQGAIFYLTTNSIIAPNITDLGKYSRKKIGYKGYKALAHLHPNHFKPDITKLFKELQDGSPFFIIRCTGFMASHDINKSGISDEVLFKLRDILEPKGRIYITSERRLPAELEKYRLNIRKNDMPHYLAFAQIFIGDSTTMSTEAAVLGTPSVEFDEYFYEIEQMIEIEEKYDLIHCFRTHQQVEFLAKVDLILQIKNVKQEYAIRRQRLLDDTIDVSSFLIWIFENYPKSIFEYFKNPNIQDRFR